MAGHRARQIAVALAAFWVASLSAQTQTPQPAPTFRSEINYVQIPVRVLDASGDFVHGLTASDFQIFEDGIPQTIAAFSAVDLPFVQQEKAGRSAQLPAKTLNADSSVQADGRIYVIVLDNQTMDAAVALRTRHVLRRFFHEGVASNDVAAIVFTGAGRGQPFTGDRRLLDAALDRLNGDGDPIDNDDVNRVTSFLAETAASMAEIKGRRKALVLVTASAICSLGSLACGESLDYVLRATQRSDVTIYTIDPAGLNAYRRSSAEFANPNSTYADGGYSEAASNVAARRAFDAARSEWRGSLDGARYLAETSGGFAVVNTNSIAQGFARLVRENSSYYFLGYYSTNTPKDGKLHRHRVTAAGKGVRVVHRIGYVASSPRAK